MPRVSIGVPLYNKRHYVGETIDSVLNQTFTDLEVIVVDNGSTDGSAELVGSYGDPRIRLVRNEVNLGMIANFNRILAEIQQSDSDYGKLLCADDLLRPRCVERQVEALDAAGGRAVASFVRHDVIAASGRPFRRNKGLGGMVGVVDAQDVARRWLWAGYNILGAECTLMFRRSTLDHCDWYPPGGLDIDFVANLLQTGDVVLVPESLAAFRLSTNTATAATLSEYYHRHVDLFSRLAETGSMGIAAPPNVTQRLRARLATRLYRLVQFAGARL